jgi:phosphopantetheinyl transferase (holo-ACP synthase)
MGPSSVVVVRASCDVAAADPRLPVAEHVPLLLRPRGFGRGVAARKAATEAVRDALAGAGLPAALMPPGREMLIRHDSRGRPYVELSEGPAQWLAARGFTVDASLAHEGHRGAAAAVVAAAEPAAEACARCGGTLPVERPRGFGHRGC